MFSELLLLYHAIDRIKVVATIKSGDIIYKKIKSEDIKIESKDI